MKKRVFTALLCLMSLTCLCFAACGEHEHTYSDEWSHDAQYHWHAATCEHTAEQDGKAAHTFGSDGKCTVCGSEKADADCSHTLFKTEEKAATCTKDGNVTYWFCSECGKYFTDEKGEHEIAKEDAIKPKTGHSYEETLSAIDRKYHGYKPTCGDTTEYDKKAEHVFGAGNTCSECGFVLKADTTAFAGKYYSYYDTGEGWDFNRDFYIEIDTNSGGLMYEAYYDYETDREVELSYPLSVEIKNGKITIGYTDGNGEKVRNGFVGDGKKLGEGTLLLDWGGGGYYFCKEGCSPEVVSGDFLLEYYDYDTVFSSDDRAPADEYSIIGYFGEETNLVIPAEINGIPVTRIKGNQVFAGHDFRSVSIGDNITDIGESTFYNCTALESIHIGTSLENLEGGEFENVRDRKTITVSGENKKLIVTNNCLINQETKTLLLGTVDSVIPTDGAVKTIGRCAFYTLRIKGKLTVPDGMEYILPQAFMSCTSLEEIVLPVTLEAIGAWSLGRLNPETKITYAGTESAWKRVIEASNAEGYLLTDMGLSWFSGTEPTVNCLGNPGGPAARVPLTVKKSAHTKDMTYTAHKTLQPSYKPGEDVTYVFAVYNTANGLDLGVYKFIVNGEDKTTDLQTSVYHDDASYYDGATLYTYTFTITEATTIEIYESESEFNAKTVTVTLDYSMKLLNVAFLEGSASCKEGTTVKLGIAFKEENYTIGSVTVAGTEKKDSLETGSGEYDFFLTFEVTDDTIVKITLKDGQGADVPTTYTVVIEESEGGTLIPMPWGTSLTDLALGTEIKLLLQIEDDYEFESLTVNGVDVTKEVMGTQYRLTVTGNMTVKATFKSTKIALPFNVQFVYDDAILTEVTIIGYDSATGEVTVGIYSDYYDYEVTSVKVNGTDVTSSVEESRDYNYDYCFTFKLTENCKVEIVVEESEDW